MANFPLGNTSASPIIFPFTAVDLTSAIDVLPNVWDKIGSLGMFVEEGTTSTIVEIDYRDGWIGVLNAEKRGTMPAASGASAEAGVFVKIPHFPAMDTITPRDIQDRFAFVPGDRVTKRRRTPEDEMIHRLTKIRAKHDLTLEYMRMGALKGQVIDGRGTVLLDIFNAFSITQQVFTFNFSSSTFDVMGMTRQIARYLELNAHGEFYDGIEIQVSPEFFDALINHPNVVKFYVNWQSNYQLQGNGQRKRFPFGEVIFSEYNAQVANAPLSGLLQQQTQGQAGVTRWVEAGAGYGYPMGARESFRTYSAPPDAMGLANAVPEASIYVSPKVLDHDKGIELFSESNRLPLCRRPNLLFKVLAT